MGNNPQSHVQPIPVAYGVSCQRGCCLCSRVRPELGKCGNSHCFLNFTLQSVLCARNVSGLQTGMPLGSRRLCLLVHALGGGLLCCFSLLPPAQTPSAQCRAHQPPLPRPCRQAGTAGACCCVLARGACTAECHLCVPGRRRGISSFLLLTALTRRHAGADGTCPEISCGNTYRRSMQRQ